MVWFHDSFDEEFLKYGEHTNKCTSDLVMDSNNQDTDGYDDVSPNDIRKTTVWAVLQTYRHTADDSHVVLSNESIQ